MWKPGGRKPKGDDNAVKDEEKARPTAKSSLSQKTLAMKFMQRKQGKKEEPSAESRQRDQDHWVTDIDPAEDSSTLVCVDDVRDPSVPPIFGRRSFGGFNKNVEDEYREASRRLRFAASEAKELKEEISPEEMTNRMIKYTGLRRGPSSGQQGGRSRKRTKR